MSPQPSTSIEIKIENQPDDDRYVARPGPIAAEEPSSNAITRTSVTSPPLDASEQHSHAMRATNTPRERSETRQTSSTGIQSGQRQVDGGTGSQSGLFEEDSELVYAFFDNHGAWPETRLNESDETPVEKASIPDDIESDSIVYPFRCCHHVRLLQCSTTSPRTSSVPQSPLERYIESPSSEDNFAMIGDICIGGSTSTGCSCGRFIAEDIVEELTLKRVDEANCSP